MESKEKGEVKKENELIVNNWKVKGEYIFEWMLYFFWGKKSWRKKACRNEMKTSRIEGWMKEIVENVNNGDEMC